MIIYMMEDERSSVNMKLVVVGLDGAGFELIDPWIKNGDLPNIAKIKREGAWADMRSVLPPVTSPNWKCYSTGKNPGKVGIFWWENIDWKNERSYYPVARTLENKEIWDYIGEKGRRVGVVGMPTTYPTKKVNGFLIAGGEAESLMSGNIDKTVDITYPKELKDELRKHGWVYHPEHLAGVGGGKVFQEIHGAIDKHFEVAGILASQYDVDFLNVTIFPINLLHHFLWDAEETKMGWKIIDEHIGGLLKQGCDLMIMSDHGSNEIKHVFNINTWLQQEGYLKLNLGLVTVLYKIGITRETLVNVISKLGLVGLVRKLVPLSLIRRIPSASVGLDREAKARKIDWHRSKAVASSQGPIYLNPNNANHNEMLQEEIRQKLEALVDPLTGDKIIERVYTRAEIYHGKYLEEAPHLIVDQAKGVHIIGGIGLRDVWGGSRKWRAENKKTGLFMAYGPNIRKVGKVEGVSILDLAPTILHLMNIPIPADMDGKVLKEIFDTRSDAGRREVVYQKPHMENKRIKEKIKGLKRVGRL